MKALRKLGKGAESVQLCEVEKPIPGPNDLLVKVMAAGICGTDLHILAEEYSHSVPVTLGHEYTGVVEQVGSGVTDFQVGDQVISVSIAYSCGTCHYCRKGDPVHCTQKASIGVNVDGAMAEYMVIPADSAMKVPEQYKGSDILALSEPIACCIRAVLEESEIYAGDVAVVSGPGIIGLLCVQLARLRGARVILSGTKADRERLELAKSLGAEWVCDNADDLEALLARETAYGPDVWIECSGPFRREGELRRAAHLPPASACQKSPPARRFVARTAPAGPFRSATAAHLFCLPSHGDGIDPTKWDPVLSLTRQAAGEGTGSLDVSAPQSGGGGYRTRSSRSLGVVLQRLLDGLLGQDRAVQLVGWQSFQRFRNRLVGQSHGLRDRFSLDELGGHGAGSDGAGTAERLELDV